MASCVQLFFEGVEGLLAGGTKADEVGFRLDYSKTELKKCIREYPGKEVGQTLSHIILSITPSHILKIAHPHILF